MAHYRNNIESSPETNNIFRRVIKSLYQSELGFQVVRRGRKLGRISRKRFSCWMFSVAIFFLIYLTVFGIKFLFLGNFDDTSDFREEQKETLNVNASKQPKSKHRKQHFPCNVALLASVEDIVVHKSVINVTEFSQAYVNREKNPIGNSCFEPKFGGHQTLEEREKSFNAINQTIHCGFVNGPEGYPSTGFDLNENDKTFMKSCRVAVSSCIFGSSDFLRRPASKLISDYSKKNVCFVMFLDEQTLLKLSSEGNIPDDRGYIGLWRIIIVKNLPYEDMRKSGKVPKFLSHRLFPSAWYSLWLDSKMRLQTDPMLIIEYFLWRSGSEYAISNHYDRHCVWDEVLQNKRLNKYNHTAIDEQFNFYQSDGLTKFDPSDPNTPLPSCMCRKVLLSSEPIRPCLICFHAFGSMKLTALPRVIN